MDESCCTCAKTILDKYDFADETKSNALRPRRLECCRRLICDSCQRQNPRFKSYCPFCQISSEPSSLPQGLRDPPTYDEALGQPSPKQHTPNSLDRGDNLPAYSAAPLGGYEAGSGYLDRTASDCFHHLRPSDTLMSLSLAYRVPISVLRSHNAIYSDSLIAARHGVLIPKAHYQGPSLSSEPLESEEEREWKAKLRRFMVQSKCSDYGVAELYLKQAREDVGVACQAWEADERWERENPYSQDRNSTTQVRRSKQSMIDRRN